MEDLSKLSLSDLINGIIYLEDFAKRNEYYIMSIEKTNKKEADLMIKKLDSTRIKVMEFRKEIRKRLLSFDEIKLENKIDNIIIRQLTKLTREVYENLLNTGEVTPEMVDELKSNKLPFRESYDYNDEELKEKFPIWALVVRHIIENKMKTLEPSQYRSIQDYLRNKFNVKKVKGKFIVTTI